MKENRSRLHVNTAYCSPAVDDLDNDDKAIEVDVKQSNSYDDSHTSCNSWSSNDMLLEEGHVEDANENSLLLRAAQQFGYETSPSHHHNQHQQSEEEQAAGANDASASSLSILTLSPHNSGNGGSSSQQLSQLKARMNWKKVAKNVDEMVIQNPEFNNNSCTSLSQKKRLREEIVSQIRNSMEFSIQSCLCAVVLYLLIAILAFCFLFEHFTYIDACYFAVVTFTTIGYGDLVPTTNAARYFTGFFALTGVACLGIVLGVIGNNIIDAQKQAMERAKKMSQKRAMELFETDSMDSSTNDSDSVSNLPEFRTILVEFALVVALLTAFALLLWDDPGVDSAEGWNSLGNAIYFSLITATTVGYGDFAPRSQKGRLCAIFFIPLAVGVMGHWLSIVATYIIDKRQSSVRQTLTKKELTMQDLDIMDEDGDGQVTQMEFLEFMLLAMNKVDKETLCSLRDYFQKLDVDGTGTLDKEDLIRAAKKKLKSGSRKLELSRYKKELLEKSMQQERPSFWSRASWSKNN